MSVQKHDELCTDAAKHRHSFTFDQIKRFIGVEELGALTLFLCGDGGRSITGAALPVDGAWTSR